MEEVRQIIHRSPLPRPPLRYLRSSSVLNGHKLNVDISYVHFARARCNVSFSVTFKQCLPVNYLEARVYHDEIM